MIQEKNFFHLIDQSTGQISEDQFRWKRAKVVCTLGPASDSEQNLRKMIRAGMNVARLNFSHGDHKTHLRQLERVRKIAKEEKCFVGILQDIQGPKIRVGRFEKSQVIIRAGQKFILTTKNIPGTEGRVSVTYKNLHKDIKPGHRVLIDDGLLFLIVKAVKGRDIHTEVVFGGVLKNNKGMNLPDTKLKISCLTAKDRKDIRFGLKHQVDFIALSFISQASDIKMVRKIVSRARLQPLLIAKIETQHALRDLDNIIEASDGLMVARGDLGVECPLEQVPGLQKKILRLAGQAGKFTITATQMLESMIWNPRPTRAEASDVANAVLDGTDALMLSAETASGKNPVDAVRTMSRIIVQTESYGDQGVELSQKKLGEYTNEISEGVTSAAVQAAHNLRADAIVAFTQSGATARLVSRLRPSAPIFALSPLEWICQRLSLIWGVIPYVKKGLKHPDDMPRLSKSVLQQMGLWKKKNTVVMLSGTPVQKPGSTNLLKVYEIK